MSLYQIRHVCQFIKFGMSLSPSNQACPSGQINQACPLVPQLRHICQSMISGMSVSTSNQACLLVHQINIVIVIVYQCIQSGISVYRSNQACLLVRQIRHIPQSFKSGLSVSQSGQACLAVHQIRYVWQIGNVQQSLDSKMYVCPVTLKCLSVPRL